MAFKMNIPLPGGVEHADGYVRVTDCRVCKKDDTSDWFMMVDVAAYKDADARGVVRPQRLVAPDVQKFKFAYSVDDGASPADAYAKLKTLDLFSSATDV
jgi:hypothetical protein